MSDWCAEDKAVILRYLRESASALERITAALEERLPPFEDANKIEALQTALDQTKQNMERAERELHLQITALEDNQDQLIAKIGELREENNRLRLLQPDLGVRCRDCGAVITGIGSIAGAMRCLACHMKPTP